MSLKESHDLPYGVLIFRNGNILLPNKMALKYTDLRLNDGNLQYVGRNGIETTYGGRITENVIQALSRIVITDAMLLLENDPELTVALTVHDEVVLIGPNENPDATMDYIISVLCKPPLWAADLPLDAEGGYARNYSK